MTTPRMTGTDGDTSGESRATKAKARWELRRTIEDDAKRAQAVEDWLIAHGRQPRVCLHCGCASNAVCTRHREVH